MAGRVASHPQRLCEEHWGSSFTTPYMARCTSRANYLIQKAIRGPAHFREVPASSKSSPDEVLLAISRRQHDCCCAALCYSWVRDNGLSTVGELDIMLLLQSVHVDFPSHRLTLKVFALQLLRLSSTLSPFKQTIDWYSIRP